MGSLDVGLLPQDHGPVFHEGGRNRSGNKVCMAVDTTEIVLQ